MQAIDIAKASAAFSAYAESIAWRENITLSKAYDRAMADPFGRGLLAASKSIGRAQSALADLRWGSPALFEKDSSDGAASRQETAATYFPPARNGTHDGSNQRPPPIDQRETGEEALARMRREQEQKALLKFNARVDEMMAKAPTMKRSQAMDRARAADPALWAAASGRSPLNLPNSGARP